MSKFLLATTAIAAVMFANAASAADLGRRPVLKAPAAPVVSPATNWSGFYIGVHGGYGWGKAKWDDVLFDTDDISEDAHYDMDGGLAGGQIGYNWQWDRTVFGLEADGSWANIKGDGANAAFDNCLQMNGGCESKIEALGTLTARLGLAFDRSLVYVKGGAAWVHEKHSVFGFDDQDPAYSASGTEKDTRWGWTVGAGIEYAFSQNWSAKVEYNYIDLGKDDVRIQVEDNFGGFETGGRIKQDLHIVKFGLNYRFDTPIVAKY